MATGIKLALRALFRQGHGQSAGRPPLRHPGAVQHRPPPPPPPPPPSSSSFARQSPYPLARPSTLVSTQGSPLSARRLTNTFQVLLRTLDFGPIIRGALRSLQSTRPAYHQTTLTESFQTLRATYQTKFPRRPPPTLQYALSVRRPQLTRSAFHGPGLQTARNFSSGGPTLMVTNAPLSLRALSDEAEDQMRKHKKTQATNRTAKASTASRQSTRGGAPYSKSKLALPSSSSSSMPAARSTQRRSQQQQPGDLEVLFPRIHKAASPPTTSAVSDTVVTIVSVPLDPDIVHILQGPHEDEDEAGHLLDGLLERTMQVTHAYNVHSLRWRAVERLISELGGHAQPNHLEYVPGVHHGVGFTYCVPGYTAEEVKALFIDRLGRRQGNWLGRFMREEEHSPAPPSYYGSLPSSPGSASLLYSPGGSLDYDGGSWEQVQVLRSPPSSPPPPSLGFSASFASQFADEEGSIVMGTFDSYGTVDSYLQDSR